MKNVRCQVQPVACHLTRAALPYYEQCERRRGRRQNDFDARGQKANPLHARRVFGVHRPVAELLHQRGGDLGDLRPARERSLGALPDGDPAIRVEVRSWIDSVIHDRSPDSAIRGSPRFSVTSRTGMTLPMILASMATPLIGVGSRWYERPVARRTGHVLSFFVRTHRWRGEVLARECGHLFAVLRGLACTSSLNRAQRG